MAAVIKQMYGIEPELIPGSGGIFEICVDGARAYVNGPAGGVPSVEEALAPLRESLRE